jgi:uncharacterized membrane protein YhaH (DUF805 family)/ribosomal protein L37AE/L43A
MNANINERSSVGLGLQLQVIICPKCQHKRTADDHGPDWQCPNCGVAYNKAAPSPAVTHIVDSASRERGSRDDLETATPSALSLATDGRIGRLRYLAFGWPIIALSYLLGIPAVFIVPLHKALGVMLLILVGVLLFLLPLRLMALRMHDVNRSGKWMLALLLLPAAFSVLGGIQMVPIGTCFFWIIALLLVLVPGSEGYNDYGPPAGANTTLVKVGAVLFLALMALGVVANIKYMQYVRSGKLNSAHYKAEGIVAEQPGSGNVQSGTAAATQNTVRLRDFVGTWQGQNMSLRVDKSGDGVFLHLDGNSSIKAYGPLRVLDGNHISIGIGPTPQVLHVAVPPHVEGKVARMTLDGVELIKND